MCLHSADEAHLIVQTVLTEKPEANHYHSQAYFYLTLPVLLISFPIYQDLGAEANAAVPFSLAVEEAA